MLHSIVDKIKKYLPQQIRIGIELDIWPLNHIKFTLGSSSPGLLRMANRFSNFPRGVGGRSRLVISLSAGTQTVKSLVWTRLGKVTARKIPENGAETPVSGAGFVGRGNVPGKFLARRQSARAVTE